jgi:ribosomal protein S18 acetylase RimI-like enzyme
MLYEAVFWRVHEGRPSFEEALAYPEVSKALIHWGDRPGDTGVIAVVDALPVGAAWFRYWEEADSVNGYVSDRTPIVVIGVHQDYRQQGIGGRLMDGLLDRAADQTVARLSLNVAKENYAIKLYRRKGFIEYRDNGDAVVMVRDI